MSPAFRYSVRTLTQFVMALHELYAIADSDTFLFQQYPGVTAELEAIHTSTSKIPVTHKGDMIVSFLKDHCIRREWALSNPGLTRLIVSGEFKTAHIESLFRACHSNKIFLTEFEGYVRRQV